MDKEFTFFWGGLYSNWYLSPIKIEIEPKLIKEFNCVEQYMMYSKALIMGDVDSMRKVMETTNPKEQKKIGRGVKNFKANVWDAMKYAVVKQAVKAKFDQNPKLRDSLLKEEGKKFVEASPFDRVWGIGYNKEDALRNQSNWGKNLLGKIITEVRDSYRSIGEEQPPGLV